MIWVLPTLFDGTTYYDFRCELDGEDYTLEFQWNERDSSWYFSVYDTTGRQVSAGSRLPIRVPLLVRYGLSGAPPGNLIALDMDGSGREAGLYDLGNRVLLFYVDEESL